MITFEWNHDDLAYVEKKLGSMKGEARRALRDAVNKTAIAARKRLLQVAQERYTVKAAGFNSRARIDPKATLGSPTAMIKVKGAPLSQPRYHTIAPKGGVKTEVLKGSGLKQLVNLMGNKAFKTKVATGNKNVQAGKRRKAAKKQKTDLAKSEKTATMILQRVQKTRYPLRSFHGPSVPKQIEMVYDGKKITSTPLKEEIELLYRKNVEQQIERFLNQ